MNKNFEWQIGQITKSLELNQNIQPYSESFEISDYFTNLNSRLEFFLAFFSENIINMIVEESNNYFIDNFTTDSGDFGRATYPGQFTHSKGINSTDILKFIGVNLIAGLTQVPEMSITGVKILRCIHKI